MSFVETLFWFLVDQSLFHNIRLFQYIVYNNESIPTLADDGVNLTIGEP